MKKIVVYLPGILAILLFIPTLLVNRSSLQGAITASDIMLAAPIFAHFGLLMLMSKLSEHSTTLFSAQEKQGFRYLIIGMFAVFAPLWVIVVATREAPLSIVVASTIGLAFALYDLLQLVTWLRGPDQLQRIVWLHVLLPMLVAFGATFLSLVYTHGPSVLNPVALFFMCRAAIMVQSKIG